MNIVVTGGAGFIGSHFIWMLFSELQDCRVTCIDKLTYAADAGSLEGLPGNRFELVEMDICDPGIGRQIGQADILFNFAAESHVDNSIADSDPFIKTNVNGTYNLLKLVKDTGTRFVQVSTDEVYGSLKNGQADEAYPLNPSSPYAASKAAADLLVQSFSKTHGLDAVITRSTNNYGPRQHIEKFIPNIVFKALRDETVIIYDDGTNVRDWIYVKDNCRGILTAALRGQPGSIYNIGYEQPKELTNLQIFTLIREYLVSRGLPAVKYEMRPNVRPGHDFRYAVNSDEIRKLHWAALTPIQEGLRTTVDWYLSKYDPSIIS
jgi:dTDP-glucose 4,6-dehydratase